MDNQKDKEISIFVTGMTIGAALLSLVLWFMVDSSNNRCAKQHNVYACEISIVHVPVLQEIIIGEIN